MDAKHQFKYTYNETGLEEFSPVEVTFEMPADVTLNQMLWNFESYLKACGFYFDGHLEIVDEAFNVLDELDGTLYEFEDEPKGGCMADFDKECGCENASSSLEKWNKDIAKLDNEIKTQRKIREMANKSADMVKDFNDAYEKLTEEQKMKAFKEACTMSGLHYEATKDEVKKNKWVHGICNPPSPDWKAQNKNK